MAVLSLLGQSAGKNKKTATDECDCLKRLSDSNLLKKIQRGLIVAGKDLLQNTLLISIQRSSAVV